MTLNEFKAWLDGFSASFDDAPNAEQWKAIVEKLNLVQPDVKPMPLPSAPDTLGLPKPPQVWFGDVTCTNDARERAYSNQA